MRPHGEEVSKEPKIGSSRESVVDTPIQDSIWGKEQCGDRRRGIQTGQPVTHPSAD